jgi:hypothetical protein
MRPPACLGVQGVAEHGEESVARGPENGYDQRREEPVRGSAIRRVPDVVVEIADDCTDLEREVAGRGFAGPPQDSARIGATRDTREEGAEPTFRDRTFLHGLADTHRMVVRKLPTKLGLPGDERGPAAAIASEGPDRRREDLRRSQFLSERIRERSNRIQPCDSKSSGP